jgi:16S rRNA (adenine1518-N6/adenine1519-N6)-dimethyltransferase
MHTKNILSKYGATPSKRLGQNFLIDKNVLEKIIKAADLKPDDVVLEVGPGIGTLTQELAKTAKKVIAIEKDRKMCEILEETLKDYKNIEIINADVLKFDHLKLIKNLKFKISNYKVVANIPYYLTSPLIRAFLESKHPPKEIILMVQKEVAQRICPACRQAGAKPPDMNLLSVSVQFYAKPEIISYVSKNCFWPSPKVDSAIIKITPKNVGHPMSHKFVGHRVSPELFFRIVKAGFSQPRKQLANNLLALSRSEGQKLIKPIRQAQGKEKISAWLLKNNIKPSQRAETLSVDDWLKLANNWQK